MNVVSNMIHKELRIKGFFIKKLFKFRKKRQFVNCNKLLRKFIQGRFPKSMCVEERYIYSDGQASLRILICSPKELKPNATGVLWLHGGGYAMGVPEQEMRYVKLITKNTNSVVILPDYTLSVDKPYPMALLDCYSTLKWVCSNSQELGINKNQIFVAGESAGGGLTTALTMYARDKNEIKIAFQMPLYPMLDCRMKTHSMVNNNAPVWDAKASELAWKLYLGKLWGADNIPFYASTALAVNYNNLPPTYTFVGNIDPFYDETVQYVQKLQHANVNAKVDVYEGCFHAFDQFGSRKPIGKLATQKWLQEFVYATENYFSNY